MRERKKEEKLGDALLKVALGYQVAEVTEEYAEVDGELKLTKRKKTKKDIPPDLKAVQLLLATDGKEDYGNWTDEELETEKSRLLSVLQDGVKNEAKNEAKSGLKTETKNAEEESVEKTSKTENGEGMVEVKAKKPRPKPKKRVVRKTKN